ncbi:MAG: MltA domain-containing protein, partial [Desulfobacterales bacterium]
MRSKFSSKKNILKIVFLLTGMVIIQLCGCAEKRPQIIEKEKLPLLLLSPSQYPRFTDDNHFVGLDNAISKSLEYLDKIPETREFQFGSDAYSTAHLKKSLIRFMDFMQKQPDGKDIERFITENYHIYASSGAKDTGTVLYTGYYEPALRGSRFPSEKNP